MDAPVKSAADEAARTRELAIANEALRETERESRLIVDCIPGLVAAFTPSGQVEFVNRQVLEYFGRTMEELTRWDTDGTTHPEDLPRVVEVFSHSMASGEPFEFEVCALRFDGVYRWFSLADFRFGIPTGTSSAVTTCSSTLTSASGQRSCCRRTNDSWKWWHAASRQLNDVCIAEALTSWTWLSPSATKHRLPVQLRAQ